MLLFKYINISADNCSTVKVKMQNMEDKELDVNDSNAQSST